MKSGTLLFRQVNPSWMKLGRVTSQAFKPTPKDRGRLSTYDGDRMTAENAWRHYTMELGCCSVGVLSVTVGECKARSLPVESDPLPFPEHVVIRFDGCSRAQVEKNAKHMKTIAVRRGWQYQVQSDVS